MQPAARYAVRERDAPSPYHGIARTFRVELSGNICATSRTAGDGPVRTPRLRADRATESLDVSANASRLGRHYPVAPIALGLVQRFVGQLHEYPRCCVSVRDQGGDPDAQGDD